MNNNFCIIMCGGIGARFWPFSRTEKPKQFLDFFGTGRSLLQMTYDRFVKIIPKENIFIVTNEIYSDLMSEQLPELDPTQFLFEPQRRNTAPCIAWASYHIRSINPNANIIVAPSDHLILKEDEFLRVVNQGLEFVEAQQSLLTLGITPCRPETGYGYIQVDGQQDNSIFKVKTFTEKPNIELAKVFLDSGDFLWNAGIFLWNVQTIVKAFETHLPELAARFEHGASIYGTPTEKEFIQNQFPLCHNISIDYGIMEKSDNVYTLSAEFGWSDLGTWGSLYELSPKDNAGNAALKCNLIAYDSNRNIVTLEDGKLAVIQGLTDYIVAESDNVLLICPKAEEQNIRQFVTDTKLKMGDKFI